MDLSTRIDQPEKMDDPSVTPRKMECALEELETINRYLGGWRTSIQGIKKLCPDEAGPIRILDVGSGGGDVADALLRGLRNHGYKPDVTGIDRSPDAVSYARSNYGGRSALTFRCQDVFDLSDENWDITHASLFLHHLSDDEIPNLLRKLYGSCRRGLVINDLHRHPLALQSIQFLTTLFSSSELVRHDAPLSVRRSFTRDELLKLAKGANLPDPDVEWHWAFRWLMTAEHPPSVE